MKYYHLNVSDNLDEVGYVPQSVTSKEIPFIIDDLGFEGPVTAPLIPPQPILKAKSKITTLLNVVAVNYLVFLVCENPFIECLQQFDIGEYNTWPMKVHQKKRVFDYVLFHASYPHDNEVINYKISEFAIGEIGDWRDMSKRKMVSIKSYQEYVDLRQVLIDTSDGLEIKHPNVVLDFSNSTKDILRLETPFVRGYYVSERLKKKIQDQNFTGLKFYRNRIN